MTASRTLAAAAATTLAVALLGMPGALAADSREHPRIPPGPQIPDAILTESGPVSVMLELEAPPASRAYAAAAGMSPRAKGEVTATAIRRIERLQASVRSQLTQSATRATVLFEASRVYAGIAVRTDAARLPAIASIPGVRAIHRLVPKERSNFIAVPLIEAPAAWVDAGKTGEGVTLGIIDTGIDYTHAAFGGPGTVSAYEEALAAKDAGEAAVYPDSSKVAGGYDFVGNAYMAEVPYKSTPIPDDNPLDCGGHGTHVGATAGGYGVTADGATYTGPWNASTPFDTMDIGPGVAPKVTLYALKVFGCEGSTNVVVEALDWAADPNGDGDLSDHLDVVNMSLGSSFGSPEDPDSVASDNAVDVGISVVASAGNSGDLYEVTGSPGASVKTLSVAASADSGEIVDGFTAVIAGASANYPALLSVEYDWTQDPGVTGGTVVELGDWNQAPTSENNTDGCDALSDADAARVVGKVVLLQWDSNNATRRCGSAVRSGNVATAGASGAILGSSQLLFEVGISGVDTIPVVLANETGTEAIHDALGAGTAVTATLTNALRNSVRNIVPPGPDDPSDTLGSFTSRGTALSGNVKPDVSAPGVSIFSAAVGTGYEGVSYSGTSMAAPATAGVAALVRQAHEGWSADEVKAAIMNTADHDLFLDPGQTGPRYDVLRAGAGRIDAKEAVRSQAVAYVTNDPGAVSVSFGVMNVTSATRVSKTVRIADKRTSGSPVTYQLALDAINTLDGAVYSVSPSSVTVGPGASKDVTVTLAVDPAKLVHKADPTISLDPLGIGVMRDFLTDVSALLKATPSDASPTLRVPVFAAPRPASSIGGGSSVRVSGTGALLKGTLTLRGRGVNNSGAEGYEKEISRISALQLVAESAELPPCEPGISTGCVSSEDQAAADLRYLGFTSDARTKEDPLSASDGGMAYFGLATWKPWRTAADISTFIVYLDFDSDGTPELLLANARLADTDIFTTIALSLRAQDALSLVDEQFINNVSGKKDTAKMHSTVMTLPLSLGALANPTDEGGNPVDPYITPGKTRVSYWVEAYDRAGTIIDVIGHPRLPLRADLAAPALTAFDSGATMPARARAGRTMTVTMDPATAGENPRLLLLHHLNVLARKAQVVPVTTGP